MQSDRIPSADCGIHHFHLHLLCISLPFSVLLVAAPSPLLTRRPFTRTASITSPLALPVLLVCLLQLEALLLSQQKGSEDSLRAEMAAALLQQRRLHEEEIAGLRAGMRAAHEEEVRFGA